MVWLDCGLTVAVVIYEQPRVSLFLMLNFPNSRTKPSVSYRSSQPAFSLHRDKWNRMIGNSLVDKHSIFIVYLHYTKPRGRAHLHTVLYLMCHTQLVWLLRFTYIVSVWNSLIDI